MAAALVAAALLAGCRSNRPTAVADTTAVPPAVPAADTTATVPTRVYTVVNFTATVEGVNANGQLRVAEDSVMWVSVNKLIELGRAMATPDSVWLRAPLLGRNDAGDYRMVKRRTGLDISFADLQDILEADDAEQRIANLARRFGVALTVKIKKRERVDTLTFPFRKIEN